MKQNTITYSIMHKGQIRDVLILEVKLDKTKIRLLDASRFWLYGSGHKESTDWVETLEIISN